MNNRNKVKELTGDKPESPASRDTNAKEDSIANQRNGYDPVTQAKPLHARVGENSDPATLLTQPRSMDRNARLEDGPTSAPSYDIRGEISEAMFTEFLRVLPIPACVVNPAFRVVAVNEACRRLSVDYQQMVHADLSALLHYAADAATIQSALERALETTSPQVVEATLDLFGTRIWGRMTFRSIRLSNSPFILVLVEDLTPVKTEIDYYRGQWEAMKREIDRRKLAEEALQESAARYREAVDEANSIILRMDRHGTVTFINKFAQRFFGFTESEIIGKNVIGTIVPEQESSGRDLRAMIEDIGRFPDQYKYNENENMRRNGERVWIAWTNRGIGDDTDRIVEVLCIGNDVTESKRARDLLQEEHDQLERDVELRIGELRKTDERLRKEIAERKLVETALKGSEERYRSLFHGSKDGIYITTKDGRLIETNQSFRDMFGVTEEELIGSKAEDLCVDPADYVEMLEQMLLKGSVKDYSVRLRRTDGTEIQCLLTGGIRYSDDGTVLQYQGIVRDVTEYKRLEQQLFQAQKMEAIGTLAGGIAHDFNNILHAISGYTELALDTFPGEANLQASLDTVLSSVERASDLVNQILTFSRQSRQERKLVDIAPIADEAIRFLRASLPSTIEIRQTIQPGLKSIVADPTEIHQVLLNLSTNASHAMRNAGGILLIALENTRVDERSTVLGPGIAPGVYIRITVSDTGIGMGKETVQRIFDPYFTSKEKGEGTGLGLAVVHGIVSSYGGAIRVQSEVGQGSTFQIYLPSVEDRPVQDISAIEAPPTGNERILYVDDEPVIVEMSKQVMEILGYQVTSLSSSIEALEVFRERPEDFDLIITDMTMPNLTGLEFAREVRKISPKIPLILCTGFGGLITEDNVESLGISEVLMKPIFKNDLAKATRRALDR